MPLKKIKAIHLIGGVVVIGSASLLFSQSSSIFVTRYNSVASPEISEAAGEAPKPEAVKHIKTPKPLKAIYMTSWVAGTRDLRANMVKLIEETELNSLVIDVKDYTGRIAFEVSEPLLKAIGSEEIRIPDLKDFLKDLHDKEIYTIGRITVFQDPYLAKTRPDLAVKRASDGGVWKDYKGLSFTDPGSKEVWDYHVTLAKEAYAIGFDELNFDYIRFPSDGPMSDIAFPWSGNRAKADVLEDFFAYLQNGMKGTGARLSADVFGITTTNTDDLNIGQVLEKTAPYFDFISPMVYPSHYPPHFIGLSNPAAEPYKVVNYSISEAVKRLIATTTPVKAKGSILISTTTTPLLYSKKVFDINKLRPWLQDFDLGAIYTPEMVQAQMRAVYDSGLDSWMLWDAANTYTRGALLPQ